MLTLIPPVHRATHRIGLYLEAGQPDALSQGESHILALLASNAGARPRAGRSMTVGELHEGLAHKRSTLTSILDRLVDRGLVTREVGPSDRRTFVVVTTARGRRVARQILNRLRALERAVGARVSRADRAGFARVMAAIEAEAHARAAARS
ncbi:MAG TPA: MarR family transcriptional regulator [Vicinamibacterales bacterium]|nr:MarR family transcriptional regulator [Vicinamibacterales bacterium]